MAPSAKSLPRFAACAALLATASAQNAPCVSPTATQDGQTMAQFMGHFNPLLTNALNQETASDPGFRQFLQTTKSCQQTCAVNTMQTAMNTMWQDSQMHDATNRYTYATEALTGAFKACYPRPPRQTVYNLIQKVVTTMRTPMTTAAPAWGGRLLSSSDAGDDEWTEARRLQGIDACTLSTSSGDGQSFVSQFTASFPSAFNQALSKNAGASTFFSSQAKSCQTTCAQSVLTTAIANFYQTGLSADSQNFNAYATDLVTGALKACYPTVPRENMVSLVSAVLPLLGANSATVSTTGNACVPDSTVQHGQTKAQFLANFDPTLRTTLTTEINNDASIRNFMVTTLACQETCLFKMWELSTSTMWSDGELFGADHTNLATEALTGGFKACYPRPPRDSVKTLVTKVVNSLASGGRRLNLNSEDVDLVAASVQQTLEDAPETPSTRRLSSLAACPGGSGTAGKTWIDSFMTGFPTAFQQEVSKNQEASTFFTHTCKDCQNTCAPTAIHTAISNLYDTGLMMDQANGKPWANEVITGALKACYPSAPRSILLDMVSTMMAGAPAFPQSTTTNDKCVPASTMQGTPPQNQATFMASFNPMLTQSLTNAGRADSAFQTFIQSAKDCQHSCLVSVYDQSIKTMWGTTQLFGVDRLDALHQALTGGFKACYPHPSRDSVLTLMHAVVNSMNSGGRRLGFDQNQIDEAVRHAAEEVVESVGDSRRLTTSCSATTAEGTQFVNNFMQQFPNAFAQVIQTNAAAHEFFTSKVKDCQNSCGPAVMRTALTTFANAGFLHDTANRGTLLQDAVTGSLKACYPLADRPTLHQLTGDMLQNLGMTRLFDLHSMSDAAHFLGREDMSANDKASPASMAIIGAAGATALVVASFALARRLRGSGRSFTAIPDGLATQEEPILE